MMTNKYGVWLKFSYKRMVFSPLLKSDQFCEANVDGGGVYGIEQ